MKEREDIEATDLNEREGDFPFLRRPKSVTVRRRRFSSRALRVVLWMLGLIALGSTVCALAMFAVSSPLFFLDSSADIVVDGNRHVSREEVLSGLRLSAGGPFRTPVSILRLSLTERKRQVESISWVRSATLARAYPHRLVVRVVERSPVAYVNAGGHLMLVDGDGVLLEKPDKAEFDFPVLTGLDPAESPSDRKFRLNLFQEFYRQVAEGAARSGWLVSEVNLSEPDDVVALLVQGQETIQAHFGDRDFAQRFLNFLALLPELHGAVGKIDSVDLRFHNQVVVSPQGAGSKEEGKKQSGVPRSE